MSNFKEKGEIMRSAGILMPISSLSSPYGIGSFGEKAYEFIDFLVKSKQTYWQILPLGPTGFGDSPYQSFSSLAINHYFIDLDILVKENLLTTNELGSYNYSNDESRVDYQNLFDNRKAILKLATNRFDTLNEDYQNFKADNSYWLDNYSLFMAIKTNNNMNSYTNWEKSIRLKEDSAIKKVKEEYKNEIKFWEITQYLAYKQWLALKKYANEHSVYIIGDIPIYVSPDSSDIWANPELFQTNEKLELTEVAGCPPDAFSADGQLWGNPLYDWDYHASQNYSWWINRVKHASIIYDVVRIDHFRGFSGYYSIPFGDDTAINGRWRKGPGYDIIKAIKSALPSVQIIAEDLGYLTEDVVELLNLSGFPGMKLIQFAFDSREGGDYLPHNYEKNSVVYTGTHDNTTTHDWQFTAYQEDVTLCKEYMSFTEGDNFSLSVIKLAFSSVSNTCIIPMADWLSLGASARINAPSTLGDNWVWRIDSNALTPELENTIAKITTLYGRKI